MRAFSATTALLLRRGTVVASLSTASGSADKKGCHFDGAIAGKPSFWVAPGVALTIAWQVEPKQADSAWLEADVVVSAVTTASGTPRVRVSGTTPCRPHRRHP